MWHHDGCHQVVRLMQCDDLDGFYFYLAFLRGVEKVFNVDKNLPILSLLTEIMLNHSPRVLVTKLFEVFDINAFET